MFVFLRVAVVIVSLYSNKNAKITSEPDGYNTEFYQSLNELTPILSIYSTKQKMKEYF